MELFFQNYDDTVTRASIPVTFEILPNCDNEEIAWDPALPYPGWHDIHVNAYKVFTLKGTSLATTNAPNDCKLVYTITNEKTHTASSEIVNVSDTESTLIIKSVDSDDVR